MKAPRKWTKISGKTTDLLVGATMIKDSGESPAEHEWIYQEDGSISQVQRIGGKLVEVPQVGIPKPIKLHPSWYVTPQKLI